MTQHAHSRRPSARSMSPAAGRTQDLTDAVTALQGSAAALHPADPAATPAAGTEESAWQQRYAALVAFLPDAYVVTDLQGRIQEASPALSGLLGFGRTYAVGKPLAAFLPPEEHDGFRRKLAQLAQRTEDRVQEWTLPLKAAARRQAEPVTVLVRVAPLHDAGGQRVGLHWLLRDVTAQTTTAQELAALTATLEQRVRQQTAELEATLKVYQALAAQTSTRA